MRLFEQQYGMSKTGRAADSNKLTLPVKSGKYIKENGTPAIPKASNMFGLTDQRETGINA
jgi:hypothetical protein